MSEGKGEALSESLAGLSVAEPTAAPAEADTGSLSSEAAPKPHAGDKIQGVVNWFNVAKGFGFITRDDGEGDVFVHQSDIYSEGFRSLRNQEPVEFGLDPIGDGRFKAVHVTGPDGIFVQGALPRTAHKRSPYMTRGVDMNAGMMPPPFYMNPGMMNQMNPMMPLAGMAHMGMPSGYMGMIPGSQMGMTGDSTNKYTQPSMPMPNPPMAADYGPGGGKRVVALNLPWHASWQALKIFFASAGSVVRADVVLDDVGRSRGYGTVQFTTEQEALNAIKSLNGVDFEGRILTVRMDKYQE